MDDQSKQAALSDLREILQASGSSIPDDAILTVLLDIEGGSVERAARAIQEDSAAERRRSGADDEEIARSFDATRSTASTFQVDDSETSTSAYTARSGRSLDGITARRVPSGVGLNGGRGPLDERPGGMSIFTLIWSAITLPLSLVQSILFLLARVFRLRTLFPGLFRGSSGGHGRFPKTKTDPRICAERFVRELEEETGATSGPQPRSSSMRSSEPTDLALDTENAATPLTRPRLPPFHIGGYSDALKLAKEQIRILMVILISEEHGDVDLFRKKTLLDKELVDLVSRPDFVVWGGNVREMEAYQVATQLEATTYPFVAFIGLQPSRAGRRTGAMASAQSSTSISTPRPAVLSRIEGSPLSATSATSIVSHISDVLLPRTTSYLERLKREKHRRELERELKAEQDRAYEEASRRDAARVAKKREEERLRAQEAERQKRQDEQKEALRRQKMAWLTWAKQHLVPPEPRAGESAIRLAFRLPGGKNLSRSFKADDGLEGVFAFVETAASKLGADSDDAYRATARPAGYVHQYGFSLVLSYPRRTLGPELLTTAAGNPTKLGEIEGLAASANLIVEGKVGHDDVQDGEPDSSDSEGDD